MAWIVYGVHATQWRASDWIARNAFELLVPMLREAGDHALADHCRSESARAAGRLNLSELLTNPANSATWRRAVAATVRAAAAEPDAAWNDATRKPEFLAALERLDTLAHGGGNTFVVELAVKKLSPTP